MANSLLDFVMSLVRDADAAAAYAADPSQAIADANLTDVTSVDVNNLIPVVSESLSMAPPAAGADAVSGGLEAGNVWASGAATSAFDAFGDQVPEQTFDDAQNLAGDLIDQPLVAATEYSADVSSDAHSSTEGSGDPSFLLTDTGVEDEPVDDAVLASEEPDSWEQSVIEVQSLDADGTGFEIFE